MDLQTFLLKHPKKHIIFDLDSTLVELKIDWSGFRKGIWETVAKFDRPLTTEIPFEPWAGLTLTNRAIAKHKDVAKHAIDAFVESYECANYHGYLPNPSLLDFIRTQKSNYSFSLWTSNTTKVIRDALEKEQILPLLSPIVTRNDVTFLKPEIDGFNLIYNPQNPKKDYLMVGDNFTDEGAAKKAGIDFLLVKFFQ